MAPDSLGVEWLAIVAAVVSAVALALVWERVRRWRAWLWRSLVIVIAMVAPLAAAAAAVNRSNELYTSWGELFGGAPAGAPAASQAEPLPAPPDTQPAAGGQVVQRSAVRPGPSGRVVSFEVVGRASGITLPAYAYLPPGYDSTWARDRLPVLEAFDGVPGSPTTWLKGLQAQTYLDREIDAGRMAPTVVVFPYQTLRANHDTECVNAVGGPAFDTFLTVDVRAAVERLFRVRTDAAGWGTIGYSAGAFCSVNLAMRHPDFFAAAISFSGYFQPYLDATTGNLFGTDGRLMQLNSPLWRAQHLPPRISLYLAAALDDHYVDPELTAFVQAIRPPLQATVVMVPVGGHTERVWRELQGPAYDWLSAHLAGPVAIRLAQPPSSAKR